eukprot:TRINITY_DN1098_c0_g1_i3.p3 TRINITY_DN1098_c0_g1~~TRINITY_DN1098_c0_g1_i3.p3  ORF type:complete len:122 (-),score=4.42 TRINITY_DN1098_c0_g1_i3:335-700(-)
MASPMEAGCAWALRHKDTARRVSQLPIRPRVQSVSRKTGLGIPSRSVDLPPQTALFLGFGLATDGTCNVEHRGACGLRPTLKVSSTRARLGGCAWNCARDGSPGGVAMVRRRDASGDLLAA